VLIDNPRDTSAKACPGSVQKALVLYNTSVEIQRYKSPDNNLKKVIH
jgi:hypothetical protein